MVALDRKIKLADYELVDDTHPALYVGTYGKYNEGSLDGMWVDITKFDSYEGFLEFCHELHSDEYDPEFMMQDYMNFPRDLYSECIGEDAFNKLLEYCEMDDEDREMLEAYASIHGRDYATLDKAKNDFIGKYESEKDFAEEVLETYDNIPEFIRGYIDIEAFTRDLFYDYHFENGFVFSC